VTNTWFMKLFRGTPPGGMSCHQVGEVLQHYLDGYVDSDRADRIAAHLDQCRRCGMDADTYRRIKATLAMQQPDMPAESVERLREFGERLARRDEPTTP